VKNRSQSWSNSVVEVFVQPENDSLLAIATLAVSSRSVRSCRGRLTLRHCA
jgi:hypothetical protein